MFCRTTHQLKSLRFLNVLKVGPKREFPRISGSAHQCKPNSKPQKPGEFQPEQRLPCRTGGTEVNIPVQSLPIPSDKERKFLAFTYL